MDGNNIICFLKSIVEKISPNMCKKNLFCRVDFLMLYVKLLNKRSFYQKQTSLG